MSSLDDLAFAAEQDIGRTKAFFPILPRLGNRWAATRPWEGLTLGLNLHLTTHTGAFLRELVLGGAQCVVSAANPGTTDPGTVHLLRNHGVEVYTGGDMEDRHQQVLAHDPAILVDNGFELLASCLTRRPDLAETLRAGVVLTRSGVDRLREHGDLPFPVLNVHDVRLRDAVENRHGIGEAVWQAVTQLTGMHLAGRRAAVVGYGPVGRGLSAWARSAGVAVEVVETDPIRRLFAHYDGYPTPTLAEALSRVHLVVTATGKAQAVTAAALHDARDGLLLVNAGTGGDEVDVSGIQRAAEQVDHIADGVVRYTLERGVRVTVLGHGHPLNIVLNSGSPEPVLLHFALAGVALAWLVDAEDLAPGEARLPAAVEHQVAVDALSALERPGDA